MAGTLVEWWGGCQAQPPILFAYSFSLALPREGKVDEGRRVNQHPSSSNQEKRVSTNKSGQSCYE